MKDKIEHKFKELLENQELPYDSAAWDSMSKLLDKKSPVAKPTNFYRWFIGGAAITAIAICTYFVFNSTNNPNNQKKISVQEKSDNVENRKVTTKNTEKNETNLEKKKTNSNLSTVDNSSKTGVIELDPIMTSASNTNDPIVQEKQNQKNTSNELVQTKNQTSPIVSLPTENNIYEENNTETHSIVVKNICVGEVQTLENKNDLKVLVVNQNTGDIVSTISANSKVLFEAKSNGSFVLKANSSIIGSFEVISGKKPSLEVESSVSYIKGVPTIKANCNVESSVSWFVNNKTVNSTSNEIEITPFKAGPYAIAVSSIDNGCKVENSQLIQISEDYNLLAVNAFEPSSFEPKRQSFMPFALTQRDVKFTMIILDRRDGGVVYRTSDASMPWNGVDMRSGQLVNSGQDFIWKVQLVNPLPGESSEYKGIITKL